MYGSLRRYRIRSGNVGEIVDKVKASLVPLLERTPGFLGYYVLNAEGNRVTSFSIGESREAVGEMNRIALEWVRQNLPDRLSEAEVFAGPLPIALTHQHA